MNKYYLIGQTLRTWECYELIIEEFTNSLRGEAQLKQRILELHKLFTEYVVIYGEDISNRFQVLHDWLDRSYVGEKKSEETQSSGQIKEAD